MAKFASDSVDNAALLSKHGEYFDSDREIDSRKEKLEEVKLASPMLRIMHELKEDFHSIFENSKDWASDTLNLIDWLEKASPYYQKSVSTIKRWFAETVGYFENRTTKAVVEGINNKLKLLKRCGFGFRNFNNLEMRALLFWHFTKSLAH